MSEKTVHGTKRIKTVDFTFGKGVEEKNARSGNSHSSLIKIKKSEGV